MPAKTKPRLTDRVLRGVITAVSCLQAGDIASAFGSETAETRKDWDDMTRAREWACAMIAPDVSFAHFHQKCAIEIQASGAELQGLVVTNGGFVVIRGDHNLLRNFVVTGSYMSGIYVTSDSH